MPILADYHMHSSFSGDSRAPMQDMAARAIALGYQEICFTEHMDLHYPASEECPEGMFLLNTDLSILFSVICPSAFIYDEHHKAHHDTYYRSKTHTGELYFSNLYSRSRKTYNKNNCRHCQIPWS